jgi:hypothetical protein
MRSRVQSLGVRSPRRAWGEESDDEGGFLSRTIPRLRHAPSAPPTFSPASYIQERGFFFFLVSVLWIRIRNRMDPHQIER